MNKHTSSITIRDVARQAGVSVATVSRYLNKSAPVSAKIANRIQTVMEELAYVPQASARQLAMGKQNTIGLLLSNMHNHFFGPLLAGIEAVVRQHNYNLLVASCRHDPHGEAAFPLGKHNTDGLLAFGNSLTDEQIIDFHDHQLPLVLIHRTPPPDLPIPFATIDNQLAIYNLISHLIVAHGRRRILWLRPETTSAEAHYRRELGYQTALAEHGIPFDPQLILPVGGDAYTALKQFMRPPDSPRFDAVFTGNDATAVAVYQLLQEAKLRIPNDVSVVGFGNSPISPFLTPPLTSIHIPTEEISRTAAEKLFLLLNDQPAQATTIHLTQLVLRQSCGCHPT